jgi:hypothetical protein
MIARRLGTQNVSLQIRQLLGGFDGTFSEVCSLEANWLFISLQEGGLIANEAGSDLVFQKVTWETLRKDLQCMLNKVS